MYKTQATTFLHDSTTYLTIAGDLNSIRNKFSIFGIVGWFLRIRLWFPSIYLVAGKRLVIMSFAGFSIPRLITTYFVYLNEYTGLANTK